MSGVGSVCGQHSTILISELFHGKRCRMPQLPQYPHRHKQLLMQLAGIYVHALMYMLMYVMNILI